MQNRDKPTLNRGPSNQSESEDTSKDSESLNKGDHKSKVNMALPMTNFPQDRRVYPASIGFPHTHLMPLAPSAHMITTMNPGTLGQSASALESTRNEAYIRSTELPVQNQHGNMIYTSASGTYGYPVLNAGSIQYPQSGLYNPLAQTSSFGQPAIPPPVAFNPGNLPNTSVPFTSYQMIPHYGFPVVLSNKRISEESETTTADAEHATETRPKKSRRMCVEDGCVKYAQGATRRCVRHGGGRRCQKEGCTKSAAGSTAKPFCIAHGGGKRCQEQNCTKSAISPNRFCFAHGGGRRCKIKGCNKGARGVARLCITHGGLEKERRTVTSKNAKNP